MYKYYTSSNIDSFFENHKNILMPGSLFEDKLLVIPLHDYLAKYYKKKVCDIKGVFAGVEVKRPMQAITMLGACFPSARELLKCEKISGEQMSLLLFDILRKDASLLPDVLRQYITTENKINEKKAYEVSCEIGSIFSRYLINTGYVLEQWERGESITNLEEEKWQKALFNKMYSHVGKNLITTITKIGEAVSKEKNDTKLPRIVVLGSPFISSTMLTFFSHIAKHTEIHHFLLSPKFEKSDFSDIHKQTKHLGMPLLGQIKRMEQKGFNKAGSYFPPINEKTILGAVKRKLIFNDNTTEKIPIENDSSLKIVSASSAFREVEILYDKLVEAFERDKELKPSEVIVLAPDISVYAPYIKAVFPEKEFGKGKSDSIHAVVVNAEAMKENMYLSGFLSLINLHSSLFTRKDILSILKNPCIMERFSISEYEIEQWIDYMKSLNIKWGMNGAHRKRKEAGNFGDNSFENAFERMILGFTLYDKEESKYYNDRIAFSSGGLNSASAGKFISLVRVLYNTFCLESEEYTLKDWCDKVQNYSENFLSCRENNFADKTGKDKLSNTIANIKARASILGEDTKFSISIFNEILNGEIQTIMTKFLPNPSGAVVFSDFKLMRAIAAKVICLLGINEGEFPPRTSKHRFDLTDKFILEKENIKEFAENELLQMLNPNAKNLSSFYFLESVLSASSSLIISHVGKDPRTNKEKAMSPILSGFIEMVNECVDENEQNKIIEQHPIHAGGPTYFESDSLFTYNKGRAKQASFLLAPKRAWEKQSFCVNTLKEETVINIKIDELIKFMDNPIKDFFENTLGIRLKDYDKNEFEEDSKENISMAFLEQYDYLNSILKGKRGDYEEWIKIEKERGIIGTLKISEIETAKLKEIIDVFEVQRKDLSNPIATNFEFKRGKIDGKNTFAPIRFSVSNMEVEITGTLNLHENENRLISLRYSPSANGDKLKNKSIGRLLLPIIVYASQGQLEERGYMIAHLTGKSTLPKYEFSYSREDAQKALEEIVYAFLENRKRPLPCFPHICMSMLEGKTETAISDTFEDDKKTETMLKSEYVCQYINAFDYSAIEDDEVIKSFAQAVYGPYKNGGVG